VGRHTVNRSDIPRVVGAVVGCYSVHLYCGHQNHMADYGRRMKAIGGPGDVAEYPEEMTGESRAGILRYARRNGWWISRDEERVLCPYHAREVKR
jgi:hypothetical protein